MGFDVDKDLYFVKKETEGIKKSLTGISLSTTGISHSMTGIKGDVEGLKVGLALVAATAQLFKVDYSFVKIDEKGVTVRGVQKIVWKNVKTAESDKAADKEKALIKRLEGLFLAKSKDEAITKAQKAADQANRSVDNLKNTLRNAGNATNLGNQQGKARAEITKLRTSVQQLSAALSGI